MAMEDIQEDDGNVWAVCDNRGKRKGVKNHRGVTQHRELKKQSSYKSQSVSERVKMFETNPDEKKRPNSDSTIDNTVVSISDFKKRLKDSEGRRYAIQNNNQNQTNHHSPIKTSTLQGKQHVGDQTKTNISMDVAGITSVASLRQQIRAKEMGMSSPHKGAASASSSSPRRSQCQLPPAAVTVTSPPSPMTI